MVARVVRDVHLAVFARDAAVALQHHRSVVIHARSTAFKQRGDDDHAKFRRELAELVRSRAGDGFGAVKITRVLGLAEIRSKMQFLQHDETRTLTRGLAYRAHARGKIGAAFGATGVLD